MPNGTRIKRIRHGFFTDELKNLVDLCLICIHPCSDGKSLLAGISTQKVLP